MASKCACDCTRPGSGPVTAMEPTICFPHLLQNACPGCTTVPHASQNMKSSRDFGDSDRMQTKYSQLMIRRTRRTVPYSSARLSAEVYSARGGPEEQTKRPPGNWAAPSSRENSSNGGFRFRQNFLPKSYESKNGAVKRFLLNKCLCFQQHTKPINTGKKCNNLRRKCLIRCVSRYF